MSCGSRFIIYLQHRLVRGKRTVYTFLYTVKASVSAGVEREATFYYPIWWSEMPMAMYSFFDEYDFSGKTIIPFSSHGGSGFSGTPGEIRRLEPGADVMDGYTVSRGSVAGDSSNLRNWVNSLNLQ